MARSAANLTGWLNEAYVTGPVVDLLKRAEEPLMMRDVAEACAIPKSSGPRFAAVAQEGARDPMEATDAATLLLLQN